MSTKQLIIAGLWVVAGLILFLVGFSILEPVEDDFQFVPLSLGLFVLGWILDRVWNE